MNMTVLYLDSETHSTVPIKSGVFAYSEGVETMLIAYALDDGPVVVWDLTAKTPMPKELKSALDDLEVLVVMHNSLFDRTVLRVSLGIDIPTERIHCTMVQALSHSLPGALGKLCEVLNVPIDQAKDKRGHNLIQLFCKDRPINQKVRRATSQTHPKEWAEFVDYARLDVEAMRVFYKRLPNWNYKDFERKLWILDQKIADRGIYVDLDLARAAIAAVDKAQATLGERTVKATEGAVQKTTQRDKLLDFINSTYGIKFPDLTSTMVEKAINDENLPPALKELLAIRAEASTSSTAKYKRFLAATSKDSRLRGMLQFNGASRTGRAAGRIVQLHNLPRPNMEIEDIAMGIEALKAGCADLLYENVMQLASNAIRGCLVVAPGKKLVVSDLSNIEGRIGAWYGGEKLKLEAFIAYDAGKGPDLYKVAYGRAFRMRPEDVNKFQRQVGKVLELFLQFQGGVGAFCTGAEAYNIDLDDLAVRALGDIPSDILKEAERWWEAAGEQNKRYGLEHDAFVTCDSLKRMWRAAHPGIVNAWAGIGGMIESTMATGIGSYGKLSADLQGKWFRLFLPSGRCLCYPAPRLDEKGFSYLGVNPYSRKWGRIRTYPGKIFENVVQATARDVLMEGLYNAESAGYAVAIHVHDEIICEVDDRAEFSADGLSDLMTLIHPWMAGLPLAAKGEEMYRYRKGD